MTTDTLTPANEIEALLLRVVGYENLIKYYRTRIARYGTQADRAWADEQIAECKVERDVILQEAMDMLRAIPVTKF